MFTERRGLRSLRTSPEQLGKLEFERWGVESVPWGLNLEVPYNIGKFCVDFYEWMCYKISTDTNYGI